MVYIKNIELANFKSFTGVTKVPFLTGFTVISGPNGSGKSNILDALLFCLGLASSRGMRAERLPDLINHQHTQNHKTAEAYVSVVFDITDINQTTDTSLWKVTRKLRATQGGNYTSTYYINDHPCNLTELHQELNRLRIYPEGYNVVLQGDVTRIITMNNRERREIIDELAGVAEFDRKIEQTKQTLAEVATTAERYRIIEQELIKVRDRLATDRLKAEKYQQLKLNIQEKQAWEIIINWRLLQENQHQLEQQIQENQHQIQQLEIDINNNQTLINQTQTNLQQLNNQVKLLGEEEHLKIAAQLATVKAQYQQQVKLKNNLENNLIKTQETIKEISLEQTLYQEKIERLLERIAELNNRIIPKITTEKDQLQDTVNQTQVKINQIASHSEQIINQQSQINHNINNLQNNLSSLNQTFTRESERYNQLDIKIQQNSQLIIHEQQELVRKQSEIDHLSSQLKLTENSLQSLAQDISTTETEINLAKETEKRLLQEERETQRQLDKLEAKKQAQGNYSNHAILEAKIPGIHGLVAQLGKVQPEYQLALEIAGGGRLSNIVVDDDHVAAKAIKFLQENRAGRATFLPLNKIKPPRITDTIALRYAAGYIDLAINLIDCQSQYRTIFAYVFGSTVVFSNLDTARPYLGQYRMVTLDGDILETSGAMTGGSTPQRSSLHFGVVDNQEIQEIEQKKQRLEEIENILLRNSAIIQEESQKLVRIKQEFSELRQQQLKYQLQLERLQEDCQKLTQRQEDFQTDLVKDRQELENKKIQLEELQPQIEQLTTELINQQNNLQQLEGADVHQEWQNWQNILQNQLTELRHKEQELAKTETELKDIVAEVARIREKIQAAESHLVEIETDRVATETEIVQINEEIKITLAEIATKETAIAQISAQLLEIKQQRDNTEENLGQLQQQQQQKIWQLEKLNQTLTERLQSQTELLEKIKIQATEIPHPLPEIPPLTSSLSEQLNLVQTEIRHLQKRLQAMEPVNMLALEEYQETQTRLEKLSGKLTTLEADRTELLLRIERFTTARLQAFQEAFTVVNENFQQIFATLSDGDGYLQLENSDNPFAGGLNLVAHPKGKPVQRLSSMSGGEKSLTALSFIFSLQKYRPSPFYAFDEVDMFLDGANVEKLAKMIKQQAQEAQFIVVSLRRPMIEASQRTIGVTQARGASTQVLGVKW